MALSISKAVEQENKRGQVHIWRHMCLSPSQLCCARVVILVGQADQRSRRGPPRMRTMFDVRATVFVFWRAVEVHRLLI
jgi:hypothetical protein